MIYITGANGWLGLNIVKGIVSGKTSEWGLASDKITAFIHEGTDRKSLLEISNEIKIVEGDVCSKKDLQRFLQDAKDSIILHTVGIIHPRRVSDFYLVNFQGPRNLLQICSLMNVKRVVIMSSNSPCGCNPSADHLFNEKSPYNPYMNYGKSKMEMERMCIDLYKEGIVDISIIRSPWFYGPYQPPRQALFFDMIKNGKAPLVGNGRNRRSMAYTENIVQGMALAATKEIASGNIYWIADEKPYAMHEIIDTIESLFTEEFYIECSFKRMKLPNIASQVAELMDYLIQLGGFYHQKIHVLSEMNKNISCSVEKAKIDLGYSPEFSLRDGMRISLKEIYER